MNFYLASSGVIPVLALAVLIEQNFRSPSRRLKAPKWLARLMTTAKHEDIEKGNYWHVPAVGGLVGWAEFVCLRTLETGRTAFGGPTVVWTALGVLGSLALIQAWIASFPEAGS